MAGAALYRGQGHALAGCDLRLRVDVWLFCVVLQIRRGQRLEVHRKFTPRDAELISVRLRRESQEIAYWISTQSPVCTSPVTRVIIAVAVLA